MVILLIIVSESSWIRNGLSQPDPLLLHSSELIILSVILEIINAFIMNHFFFSKEKINVKQLVVNCFSNKRFAFISLILASILFINPFAVFNESIS